MNDRKSASFGMDRFVRSDVCTVNTTQFKWIFSIIVVQLVVAVLLLASISIFTVPFIIGAPDFIKDAEDVRDHVRSMAANIAALNKKFPNITAP